MTGAGRSGTRKASPAAGPLVLRMSVGGRTPKGLLPIVNLRRGNDGSYVRGWCEVTLVDLVAAPGRPVEDPTVNDPDRTMRSPLPSNRIPGDRSTTGQVLMGSRLRGGA